MYNNQLREDGLARHEFLMREADEWRRSRNMSVSKQATATAVSDIIAQLRPIFATLLTILTK